MEWQWALLLLIGSSVALMLMGIPVALAFFGTNIIGALIFLGGAKGLEQVARNVVEGLVTFSLSPIAMFVLMGEIMFQTGVAMRAVNAIDKLISRVPGRLAIVAVVSGTVFSALSGSSVANTALMGTTLMPEMQRRGYHLNLAMGPILGTGGLAMLIPPSSMAVLLGSLSGISIAGILIGSAVPGFILAVTYVAFITVRCRLNPSLAPGYEVERRPLWQRLRPFLIYVVPLLSLFVVVVGSILAGLATPTESAALGAIAALIAAAGYRSLTWQGLRKALVESGKITVMIYFIIAASLTFSQILSFSGATTGFLKMMQTIEATPVMLVFGMMMIVLLMGCFLDPVSIMLITLPFFMPTLQFAGIDPIWFGILLLLGLEIGQITPPFGMILFAMKGIAPPAITMRQVYVAAGPYILIEISLLIFLIFVPQTVTWLPALLRN